MKTTNNQSIETLMGATLVWLGASNLQGEYLLESYTKATKGKAEVWLHDKASGHIITMDLSRRTLGDLQQKGEHRTDAGTTIRIKRDADRPLWITIDNGVAGDIFKEWGKAVSDLQRHVYNTLQDCCGCKIHRESATRYQAYSEDDDEWEVSEVVPFDPTNPNHREAYEAQRDRLGLPELPAITEADGIKVGDKVRHNLTGDRVATVTGIRRVQGYKWEGEITVYRLDFGESVKGPCGMEMNGGEYQREAFTLQNSGEITDENEAARALAGKEAHFVISDKDGRETLSHSFMFKDSFRNQANRIWIDVKEKGDVIGRWMMLKYDVIKELANTGRVVVSHPDGERHCITLA